MRTRVKYQNIPYIQNIHLYNIEVDFYASKNDFGMSYRREEEEEEKKEYFLSGI